MSPGAQVVTRGHFLMVVSSQDMMRAAGDGDKQLSFFHGDLGFFWGFQKARVFLGSFKISPENTYFRIVFAEKQVVLMKK